MLGIAGGGAAIAAAPPLQGAATQTSDSQETANLRFLLGQATAGTPTKDRGPGLVPTPTPAPGLASASPLPLLAPLPVDQNPAESQANMMKFFGVGGGGGVSAAVARPPLPRGNAGYNLPPPAGPDSNGADAAGMPPSWDAAGAATPLEQLMRGLAGATLPEVPKEALMSSEVHPSKVHLNKVHPGEVHPSEVRASKVHPSKPEAAAAVVTTTAAAAAPTVAPTAPAPVPALAAVATVEATAAAQPLNAQARRAAARQEKATAAAAAAAAISRPAVGGSAGVNATQQPPPQTPSPRKPKGKATGVSMAFMPTSVIRNMKPGSTPKASPAAQTPPSGGQPTVSAPCATCRTLIDAAYHSSCCSLPQQLLLLLLFAAAVAAAFRSCCCCCCFPPCLMLVATATAAAEHDTIACPCLRRCFVLPAWGGHHGLLAMQGYRGEPVPMAPLPSYMPMPEPGPMSMYGYGGGPAGGYLPPPNMYGGPGGYMPPMLVGGIERLRSATSLPALLCCMHYCDCICTSTRPETVALPTTIADATCCRRVPDTNAALWRDANATDGLSLRRTAVSQGCRPAAATVSHARWRWQWREQHDEVVWRSPTAQRYGTDWR